jgi:DNA-binding NarL/FixJ family response regulator
MPSISVKLPFPSIVDLAQQRINGVINRQTERAFACLYAEFAPMMMDLAMFKFPSLQSIDNAAIEEAIATLFSETLRRFPLNNVSGDVKRIFRCWVLPRVSWIPKSIRSEFKWDKQVEFDPADDEFSTAQFLTSQQKEVELCEFRAVRSFIPKLSDETREILHMRARGKQWKTIALRLSKKETTLKMKVHRLRAAMRLHIQLTIQGKL